MTCLSALDAGHPGTVSQPVNSSKGCGGVMRVAPAGLAGGDLFSLGCQAAALTAAVRAAELGPLSADAIGILGQGWTAEEALAIATHCALTAGSFRSGVLHAVNHDGDSDSTGAICGNLLGAALGATAIDGDLLARLKGRDVITQVTDDLHDVFAGGRSPDSQRYPAEEAEQEHA